MYLYTFECAFTLKVQGIMILLIIFDIQIINLNQTLLDQTTTTRAQTHTNLNET